MRTREIAVELHYSPHRVSMIINSPLFDERKAALVRELRGEVYSEVLRDIERDALRNFETLQEMRDKRIATCSYPVARRADHRAVEGTLAAPATRQHPIEARRSFGTRRS
jgi:hypothetical protein